MQRLRQWLYLVVMTISDHQDTVNIEQLMEYGHHLLHYKEITGCSCRRFNSCRDKTKTQNSEETTGRGKRKGEEEEHHHNAMQVQVQVQVQETKDGQHHKSVLCTRFCCLL